MPGLRELDQTFPKVPVEGSTGTGTVAHPTGPTTPHDSPEEALKGLGIFLAVIVVVGLVIVLAGFALGGMAQLIIWLGTLWRRVRKLPPVAVVVGVLLVVGAGGGHAGMESCHAHAHHEDSRADGLDWVIWLTTAAIGIAGVTLAISGWRDWRQEHRWRAGLIAESNRRAAIERLKTLRPEDAKDVLLNAIRQPDPEMRTVGIQSLSRQQSQETTELFFAALQDPSVSVQEAAVNALAEIREPPVVERLVHAFLAERSPGSSSRYRILDAVDPNWPRRPEARSLIRPLTLDLTRYDGGIQSEVRSLLDRIDEHWRTSPETAETLPSWIDWLQSEDAIRRESAAIGLGEIGDPRAKAALTTALGDKMSAVRTAAREALTKLRIEMPLNDTD